MNAKKSDPVLTLLGKLRGRSGMYIGQPSIVRLAAFLGGYDLALRVLLAQRRSLSELNLLDY